MSRRSANPAFTDQEWQLNALMKETLLTFLTRIAFLLGDAQKDPDAPALLKHALGLLDDTLALWPNVPVKMSFLNRMLEGNLQQSLDPPPALLIGERALASMLSRYQLHCKSSVFQLQDDFARRQCFHRNSEDAEQADCLNCTIFPKHRVSVQAWR